MQQPCATQRPQLAGVLHSWTVCMEWDDSATKYQPSEDQSLQLMVEDGVTPSEFVRVASLGTTVCRKQGRWCSHHFSLLNVGTFGKESRTSFFSEFCLGTRNDELLAENRVLFMSMGKKIFSQSKLTRSKRIYMKHKERRNGTQIILHTQNNRS